MAKAAQDFLKAVAQAAKVELGYNPRRIQRGMWMVRTTPNSMAGQEFERDVFDGAAVSIMCQKKMHDDFPQLQVLEAILVELGIPSNETWFGFLLPLVHHWLELPAPFEFEEKAISRILNEFVEAIVDSTVMTRSRDAIEHLGLPFDTVAMEDGISIRPITDDELWEFCDVDRREWLLPHFLTGPNVEWKVLDIKLTHDRQRSFPFSAIEIVRQAMLASLCLSSSGWFRVIDLGREVNYGLGAIGRVQSGIIPREFGRGEGAYILDAEKAKRLKKSWPRLRQIMESTEHYLRLPAQRLVDGGGRERHEDAIVDYAIGLEVLLTAGITDELRYRFALRGATILGCSGGDKKELFQKLRDFYNVRSSIVHGSHVEKLRLDNARSVGESALREIWWWYFDKGVSELADAISLVDEMILS